MNPVFFEFFGFPVRFFGVSCALGIFLLFFVLRVGEEAFRKINNGQLTDLVILTTLGALIGSRATYVLLHVDYFFYGSLPLMEVFSVWHGGLELNGGLLGGFAALWGVSTYWELKFSEVLDYLIPGVFLIQAVGSIGSFLNGDMVGTPTQFPWGVIPQYGAVVFHDLEITSRHPVSLYAGGMYLFGFSLLLITRAMNFRGGFVAANYLLYFSVIQFVISLFRVDDIKILDEYKLTHLVSIWGVSLSLALIIGLQLYQRQQKENLQQRLKRLRAIVRQRRS